MLSSSGQVSSGILYGFNLEMTLTLYVALQERVLFQLSNGAVLCAEYFQSCATLLNYSERLQDIAPEMETK